MEYMYFPSASKPVRASNILCTLGFDVHLIKSLVTSQLHDLRLFLLVLFTVQRLEKCEKWMFCICSTSRGVNLEFATHGPLKKYNLDNAKVQILLTIWLLYHIYIYKVLISHVVIRKNESRFGIKSIPVIANKRRRFTVHVLHILKLTTFHGVMLKYY